MDRLFLDANILFSAAYREDAGLCRLWKLKDTLLCSSLYAVEEARINLEDEEQRRRLTELVHALQLFEDVRAELPPSVHLPEKDLPILRAAIAAKATHLLTGDIRHFGPYFGRKLSGVLVQRPGDYLKER